MMYRSGVIDRQQNALDARRAISELLAAEGFTAMSREVLDLTDFDRITRCVRVVINRAPATHRRAIIDRFRYLGLY